MSQFFVRTASAADNESLCELSRVPNAGQISLALERYPDFFAGAQVQNEAVEINLCCDRAGGDRIAAVFSTGRRNLFLNNEACWVRYLSDVRILPEYHGRRPLRMINDHIIERERSQPSPAIQSVMFSDNDAMRGAIRRRPPEVLRRWKYLWFYKLGTYRTSAVSLTTSARRHRCCHSIRRATLDDVAAMQSFFDKEAPAKQLYPNYRFGRLTEPYYQGQSIGDYFLAFDGAELVGITGVWDQQGFKQTRVVRYGGALRWCRPLFNLHSRTATGFSLPVPGTILAYFYLHTIVVKGNSADIFRDLVERIHAEYRGRDYLYFVCGLFSHDPLVRVIDSFKSRRDIMGQHYQAGADELTDPLAPEQPMYVEAARI